MNSAPCGSSGPTASAPKLQVSHSFTPPPLWKIITIWNKELHSSLSQPNQSSQSIKWKVVDYFASHALKRDGMVQLFSQHAFMVVVDSFRRIDPHPDYYATRHGINLYPMIDYVLADETDWELVLYAEINQLLVPGLVKHPASKLVILGGQLDCDKKQIVVNCKGTKIRTWLIHVVGDDTGKILASPSNLGSHTGAPYETPVKPDKYFLEFTQLPSVNGQPEMFLEILPCHTDKFFSIAELNTKLVNGCKVVSRPGGAGASADPPKKSKVKPKSKTPSPSSPESQSSVPNSFQTSQDEEQRPDPEAIGLHGGSSGSKECSESESTSTTYTEPVGVGILDSPGILDQSCSLLLDPNDPQSEESMHETLFGAGAIPAPTTITKTVPPIQLQKYDGKCPGYFAQLMTKEDKKRDSTVPPIKLQKYDGKCPGYYAQLGGGSGFQQNQQILLRPQQVQQQNLIGALQQQGAAAAASGFADNLQLGQFLYRGRVQGQVQAQGQQAHQLLQQMQQQGQQIGQNQQINIQQQIGQIQGQQQGSDYVRQELRAMMVERGRGNNNPNQMQNQNQIQGQVVPDFDAIELSFGQNQGQNQGQG